LRRRDAFAAGEEQFGRCAAEQIKYYRVYLYSGKVPLAALYLLRARVVGHSFAAALIYVSTVVTPPALRRLHMRHKISAWAFGGPAGADVWKEKSNSAEAQRKIINIIGFIYTVAG
jgi:hypothetical protein